MIIHKISFQKKVDKKISWELRLLSLGLCIAILFTCGMSAFSSIQAKKQPDFSSYTQRLFQEQLASDTLALHYTLAEPSNYGIEDYDISLGSLSEADRFATRLSCENIRAALDRYDYASLSVDDRLTYDIVTYTLDRNLEGCDYYDYEEPLGAISGIQAELPILLAEYTFRCRNDIEDYLALIDSAPAYFSQIIDFEERKAAKGLFMPTFAADAISQQISSLLTEPAFNCLRETFPDKLKTVSGLSPDDRMNYLREHDALIEGCLVPAYESLRECLSRLRSTSTHNGGLCQLPHGDDYYAYLVKKSTASSRTVDELNEMIALKRQSNLSQLAKIIRSNPDILSSMSSVNLMWNTPQQMVEHLKECMSHDFPQAPEHSYEIKTVEPAMQSFLSPAFYLTAPMDDPDENNIYINPAYERTDLELFTTLAHEGYPGHLYETVFSYEQNLSPLRHIMSFGGYTEGWATYSEMMSYYFSTLTKEQATLFQRNSSVILALYALADMGIHYDGWKLADVAAFFHTYGITDDATIEDIYDLIIADPANYLKYYIGYLEFQELKKNAVNKWGDNFSQMRFHKAVLDVGPASFDVIQKYVFK